MININLLEVQVLLKKYERAEENILRSMNVFRISHQNWIVYRGLLFSLYISAKRYTDAYNSLSSTLKKLPYERMSVHIRDTYKLFEAYVNFLRLIGVVDVEDKVSTYKINKFLNEVPHFETDKMGMNIPLLIGQLLFFIQKKDYEGIIDRVEALGKYCTRYVRKDHNYRANCFIKMLLQIPKAEFNSKRLERYAKRWSDKLFNDTNRNPLLVTTVEVIPYEDLWELILQYLEAPVRRSTHFNQLVNERINTRSWD